MMIIYLTSISEILGEIIIIPQYEKRLITIDSFSSNRDQIQTSCNITEQITESLLMHVTRNVRTSSNHCANDKL